MSARKRYRPKHRPSTNTLFIAIQGQRFLSKADQAAAALRVHMAVDAVSQGKADKADWLEIFDAVNLIEQWNKVPKIMRGAGEFVDSIQNVVVGIMDRQKATGAKALHANELQALRDLSALWAEVLSGVTHADYFKAQEKVALRVQQVLRSKRTDVRVVEAV
jgi:hypothetical protein